MTRLALALLVILALAVIVVTGLLVGAWWGFEKASRLA